MERFCVAVSHDMVSARQRCVRLRALPRQPNAANQRRRPTLRERLFGRLDEFSRGGLWSRRPPWLMPITPRCAWAVFRRNFRCGLRHRRRPPVHSWAVLPSDHRCSGIKDLSGRGEPVLNPDWGMAQAVRRFRNSQLSPLSSSSRPAESSRFPNWTTVPPSKLLSGRVGVPALRRIVRARR